MEVRYYDFNNIKGLHFGHLNVRSLWSKFDLLKPLIQSSGLTLMSFSETWLTSDMNNNYIEIPGYICLRQDRTWIENGNVKKGGGVCCYIKNNICTSSIEFYDYNRSTKDIEILWLSINIPNCKKLIVGNVYRPPQGNVKNMTDTLDDLLQQITLYNNSADIFLLGDFNVNYKDATSSNTKTLKWFEQRIGLKQIITDITRFSDRNSCIDLIFTNSGSISNQGTLDVNISDHEMIFVTRKHVSKEKNPSSFNGRLYKNYNENLFLQKLSLSDWDAFYQCNDPNEAWNIFENKILGIIDVMCPVKKFHVRHLKDPWISQEILEAIKDKDMLLSLAKRTNKIDDWFIARRRRNEVKNIVKNAKSNFIKDNLNEFENDSKKFWKTIRTVIPSSKGTNSNKIILKNKDGKIIENPKELSNEMNSFFTSIGPNLARDMREPWSYEGITIDNNMADFTTNSNDVLKLLKEINVNKSSAINNLSSKILKPAFILLVDQLTFIYNLCFRTDIFPTSWKKATVTPLPKEGDMSQCTNYRPISQLPLPGKILEQIIHKKIDTFCNENDILNKNQGGFRKNHSTVSTVANFTDNLYTAINNNKFSLATFIDFSKAFDTVNHDILIKKLGKLGIRGKNQNLIKNYLENRLQKTVVNDIESDFNNISCGVPQGSVLGPLLFLIYVNDLCNAITRCCTYLYADDTVLIANESSIYTAHRNLQHDLGNVTNWCKGNKLSINVKKTKGMLLGTRSMVKKRHFIPKLTIQGMAIDYVYQYKYLGVTIDEILSFRAHLNNTIKLVAHKILMLSKIRKYITEDAAIKIYKTMILPYVDYGDIFFINSNQQQTKKLQTLQNRALRICLNTRLQTPIKILHQSIQLPKLTARREAHLINFMYKYKNNEKYLNNRNVRTRLHDAPVFKTLKPNNEKYKNNVFYIGAVKWNNLPSHIRNIETYNKFKWNSKNWSIRQLYNTV